MEGYHIDLYVINTDSLRNIGAGYAERVVEPPHNPRKRYGWHTGSSRGHGKYAIIDNLAAELTEDQHGIRCAGTFAEMITFKQSDDGSLGADEGFHDDQVMSFAIAKWVRKKLPLPNAQTQRQEHFIRAGEEDPATVSVNAWQGC